MKHTKTVIRLDTKTFTGKHNNKHDITQGSFREICERRADPNKNNHTLLYGGNNRTSLGSARNIKATDLKLPKHLL